MKDRTRNRRRQGAPSTLPVAWSVFDVESDEGGAYPGELVYAASEPEARKLGARCLTTYGPEHVASLEVSRVPEADKFRGARFGPNRDRAYRLAGFLEDGSTTCETCGLAEFESVPESVVCDVCSHCHECFGHGECRAL